MKTQRSYQYAPPGTGIEQVVGLSGLEQLRAMVEGKVPPPPVFDLLGMESFEADPGRVAVSMRAQEFHYNPLGGVHGGVIATLLDTAAACSVHSTLEVGETYTSLDLTTKFLRPVSVASGLLRCEGKVVNRGRRVALATAELTDQSGKLVAYASSTCLIISG